MPRLPCRDIDFFSLPRDRFFIAAISIFSSPRYRFFSSPRYRFFHRHDIDFFIATISIFSSPRHRFFFVTISFFCPITAIFIRPYSRATIRRCSSIFALTGTHQVSSHRHQALFFNFCADGRSAIIIARRRALFFNFCTDGRAHRLSSHTDGRSSRIFAPTGAALPFCADGRALQSLSRADGRCSSIFAPTGTLCNHHRAPTGAVP